MGPGAGDAMKIDAADGTLASNMKSLAEEVVTEVKLVYASARTDCCMISLLIYPILFDTRRFEV